MNGYDTGSLYFNTIKLLGAGKLEIRDVKVNGKNTKASVSKPKNDVSAKKIFLRHSTSEFFLRNINV